MGRTGSAIATTAAGLCVAALGVWGLAADRSDPTSLGQVVSVEGGSVRVDAAWVLADPMAAMHGSVDQFAQSGMSMPSMLPDAVPEGMQRVAVQLHLAADDEGDLVFETSEFELRVGDTRFASHVSLIGDGRLRQGEALDGVMTFDIPQEAETAALELPGSDAVIDVTFAGDHNEAHP